MLMFVFNPYLLHLLVSLLTIIPVTSTHVNVFLCLKFFTNELTSDAAIYRYVASLETDKN